MSSLIAPGLSEPPSFSCVLSKTHEVCISVYIYMNMKNKLSIYLNNMTPAVCFSQSAKILIAIFQAPLNLFYKTNGALKCTLLLSLLVEYSKMFLPCLDIDECANPATCGIHPCVNTQGGYICLCLDGYRRANDGRTCVGKLALGTWKF